MESETENRTELIQALIPKELKARIAAFAEKENRTVSNAVWTLLERQLNNEG